MGCRWLEAILALVIIVFTYWPTMLFSTMTSEWIVIVAAVLLLIHALFCAKCKGLCMGMMGGSRRSSGHRRRR